MAVSVSWRVFDKGLLLVLLLLCTLHADAKKSSGRDLIEDIVDMKQYKKLLRTKKNVMILYTRSAKDAVEPLKICSDVALELKGQATLASVDCSGEGKKLCKKLKAVPDAGAILKHYKDGEFHKDYDRKLTPKSLSNFLKDPTGDIPWEEDEESVDVAHVPDGDELRKLFQKETSPILIMFYAPWCVFCKRLKPDYAKAATELKGHSVLAAMDLSKPENAVVRHHYNVTGFPTLIYFEAGNLKHKYEGENNKEAIVAFMKNPEKKATKPKEEAWSDTPSDVVHLTEATFDDALQSTASLLVMFYAPWCVHCKKMHPEYVSAAAALKKEQIPGTLAAVDAVKEKALGKKYNVSGYPTVKYFENGQHAYDVQLRTAAKIVDFMKDPKEPPPPPPPEVPWSQVPSEVVHLDEANFKPFLKRKKHALVMFYTNWCGHCKRAKPEFAGAAEKLKDDPKVAFAAVDCTEQSAVCGAYDVGGYPTIKYFSYLKTQSEYNRAKTVADFINFIREQSEASTTAPPVSPPTPTPASPGFWSDVPGADHVKQLTTKDFQAFVEGQDSVLVMFYASWCGFCKDFKPIFAEAALKLHDQKVPGVLVAVDAAEEKSLATKYKIRSLPTVQYFRRGKFVAEYDRKKRAAKDLIDFMKSPPTARKEEL
uniref:Putative thioredoxin/protein disulfide isomerase n=2 Tax=Ixodes ricinus TaxID=34613 RepID=V5GM30_IXORI